MLLTVMSYAFENTMYLDMYYILMKLQNYNLQALHHRVKQIQTFYAVHTYTLLKSFKPSS